MRLLHHHLVVLLFLIQMFFNIDSSAVENGGSESHRAVKKFKEFPNKSAEKLSNSSFDLLEKLPSKLRKTRSITKSLGIRESQLVSPATGYKIVDFPLLQNNLTSFVCCGNCKRKNRLKLLTDHAISNYGLAEEYIICCDICKYQKYCWTSEKLILNEIAIFFM